MLTDLLGWTATAIPLVTIARQVYSQWRQRSTQGVRSWLFIGQLAASTGFLIYSYLLGNWVFVVSKAALLVTAALGQWIFWHNRRREERQGRLAQGGS
ncbi:MAG: hypothetical protein ING59_08305 [Burkholderiales bacterium]|nr:hypothetical protein [Burkholderiales bacterium]